MKRGKEEHLGGVAAAILSAGVGAAACGVFYVAGAVKAFAPYFNLYKPSGALSGVSTAAILVWLVAWLLLARGWRGRTVDIERVCRLALGLLALGLLLTYPPLSRLL